jgi:tetratricopeptide (TPR) repeat protein
MQTDVAPPAEPVRSVADVVRPAQRYLDAGDIQPAKSLLDQGLQKWPNAGALRMLAARIAEAEGRADDAAESYHQAVDALRAETERFPDSPQRTLALARALAKCGEADAAAAAFALARERGADPVATLRAERGLALSRKDWTSLGRVTEQLIGAQDEPGADDFVALAAARRRSGDPDGAAAAAARALERDPANVTAANVAAWAALRLGDAEGAIAQYRRLAQLAPDNPNWSFQCVRMLVMIGRVGEAARELDAALPRWPNDASLRAYALNLGFRSPEQLAPIPPDSSGIAGIRDRELRQLRDRTPADPELRRPVITDDKARDVIVAEMPGASVAVLVFTGLNDVMSMPLPLFDRYLAALGVSAIYLKDFRRLLYLRGIVSLGEDYPATIAALEERCRRLGAKRLCTIGNSAGGYAAVSCGIELGADRMVSVAGETHLAQAPAAPWEHGYTVIRKRIYSAISKEEMDLRRILTAAPFSGSVELVYPDGLPRDQAQAMYLAGVPGVTLHPVAGCGDHNLLSWLALHADLRAMLAELLDLAPSR